MGKEEDFQRRSDSYTGLGRVGKYLKTCIAAHRPFLFHILAAGGHSHTWIIIACGHQLVWIVLSTVRRGEKHLMLEYLSQRARDYNLASAVVEGFGIGCILLRSNYLLSWKARNLGKEELPDPATRTKRGIQTCSRTEQQP